MDLDVGICPKCREYLLLKANAPFLVCPKCGQSISRQLATEIVEQRCADPEQINLLVGECISLEINYGSEIPGMILAKIVDNFPLLESPAYLLTKMSGYEVEMVSYYLHHFANLKSNPSNVPWAEEFLDSCLTYRNMEFGDLWLSYVNNKVRPEKQETYRQKIAALRKEYTFKASDPASTKWLLTLYLVSAVVNVLLLPVFMLLSGWLSQYLWMYYAINIAIGIAVICLEILLLYLHNKVYGNRLNMSETERLCMVIFMSSMVFLIGATVMGSIWKITL